MRALVLCVAVVAAVVGAGCLRPCRGIETVPITVTCEDGTFFTGEMHFDDAPTFASFLEIECMPSSDEAAIDEVVSQVDFTTSAAFLSTGTRATGTRCIEERSADEVDVCDEGLRVAFADRLSDDELCAGKWTVAFTLPREELRAALQSNEF